MAGWRPWAVSRLWAVVILGLLMSTCQVHAAGRMLLEPAVAATCSLPLFVFGASYMDVGQNSAAMPFRELSEFPPYGIDYFGRPTGRFSNGRLVIDHICEISLSLSLSCLPLTPVASFTMRFAITGATVVKQLHHISESQVQARDGHGK